MNKKLYVTIADVAEALRLSRGYASGLFSVCSPDGMSHKRLKIRTKWGVNAYDVEQVCDWLERIGNSDIVTPHVRSFLQDRAKENATREKEFFAHG